MLAGIFIQSGLDAVQNPKPKVPKADKVAPQVAEAVGIDAETVDLVRFNGGVQVVGGVALALGVMPRVAALALAGSLVPTTFAGHRFWEEEDPSARAQQLVHFLKNTAILGGLLIVVSAGK